jgi:hypothetical protein
MTDCLGQRALVVLALELLSLPARSQQGPAANPRNRFELYYEPVAGCPSYQDARVAITRRAPSAATAPRIGLGFEFQPSEGGRDGRLVIREAGRRPRERQIHAKNCAELIDAMALIAAIALERSPRAQADPAPGEAVASYPTVSGRQSATQTRAVTPAAPPAPGAATGQAPRRSEPAATHKPGSLHPGLGVGVRYNSAVAPNGILAEAGFAELGWGHTGIVGLDLRGELSYGRSPTTSTEQGDARFTWTSGRLLVCPISASPAELLELGLCATGELGTVAVSVSGTATGPRPARVVWSSLGGSVRAALVWDPLRLEGEGGIEVPLLRDSFYFAPKTPQTEVHRIPAVGLGAGASLGVRF